MRRLPVYFLIDVSENMAGEPIEEIEAGMRSMIRELKSDPYALDSVFVSVLVFAGRAEVLTPLTELYQFAPPKFPVGYGSAPAKGLELLMAQIDKEKASPEQKGGWKPIVFILSGSQSADNPFEAIEKWRSRHAGSGNLAVVGMGPASYSGILAELGGENLALPDCGADSLRRLFKWIGRSIKAGCRAINDAGLSGEIFKAESSDKPDKLSLSASSADWLVYMGKCSKNGEGYINKYALNPESLGAEPGFAAPAYALEGCHCVDAGAYERLGGAEAPKLAVNLRLLGAIPACPHCGNPSTMLVCPECGNIFCGPDKGQVSCPWCGSAREAEFLE